MDRWPGEGVDLVATVWALPFADASVDLVYCGHLLEHLRWEDEVGATLAEVRRILSPGGELCVVGPDMDRAVAQNEPRGILDAIREGSQDPLHPGKGHQWTCTGTRMLSALTEAGFAVQPLGIEAVPALWPVVSRVAWQCAALARP